MPDSVVIADAADDGHAVSGEVIVGQHEAALWRRHREGDPQARAALITHFQPYARTMAATYYGRRIDDDIEFEEYHQWALVAMIESIDRFDSTRGFQFNTFASRRIHGSILDGIESATEKQRQIAMRRRLREERVAETLKAAKAGDAKNGEGIDDVFRILAEVGIGLALGLMLEDSGMISSPPDATVPDNAYAHAEQRELNRAIHQAMALLTEQEHTVIRRHYVEEQRFNEIAQELGLTRGRISQIHRQALERLRCALNQAGRLDISL